MLGCFHAPPGDESPDRLPLRLLKLTLKAALAHAQHFRQLGNRRRVAQPLIDDVGQPYSYVSEEVWTYETGYRFQSRDNRATFAATAFYNVYDNPQFFLETQPGNRFSIEVVNLPEGVTYGAEFEGRAVVAEALTVFGSLGLLHTEITESTASNPQLVGNRFGKDPDVTASLGFVWTPTGAPYFSLDGKATYVGESFNDFNNVSDEIIGGYTLVDVGVNFERDGLKARIFVNNLLDETGLTALIDNFAAVTPPRTGGLSVTAKF